MLTALYWQLNVRSCSAGCPACPATIVVELPEVSVAIRRTVSGMTAPSAGDMPHDSVNENDADAPAWVRTLVPPYAYSTYQS